ncbi:MAG: hypothetical protein AB7V13_10215 [Pseudorhodoplanes sp.]|uniref:hypothetical protein n=1 Tax=Pseudorhodoplanes sp. TaxID=1934341 RepID=UPI003D14533F
MPLSSDIRPGPNPPLDRARVIRAREMYAEGFTVSRILAHCQMALGTLYACLDGVPFGQDGERMEPLARRRDVTGKRRRALKACDVSLVNRLLRTAERQVRDIETRLAAREVPPVERERDVRMLGSLVRALRDLQALRKQDAAPRAPAFVDDEDEDEDRLPADVDAIYRELCHKMEAMAAGAPAAMDKDG